MNRFQEQKKRYGLFIIIAAMFMYEMGKPDGLSVSGWLTAATVWVIHGNILM